jgi:ATP-dependent DNA helicase RecG
MDSAFQKRYLTYIVGSYRKSRYLYKQNCDMKIDINNIIGETTEYDKKEALEVKHPKSWCKSVSAFANGTGGCLIFGIADDDTIVGLDSPQQAAEKFSEIVNAKLDPVPDYRLSFEEKDGKTLMIAIVDPGNETPYYYRGDGQMIAYVRSGNESMPASVMKLRELVLKGTHQYFDGLPTDFDFSNYSFSKLRATFHAKTGKVFTDEDYVSWGIVDENGKLTNAGALLSDENPIYQSRVFCTRWNGLTQANGLMDALDDLEVSGSIVYQLQEALSFCRRSTKKMWYKTPDGRVELPDYPEEAILEGLVNGLIHRSYLEIGSEVHVDIFDNRIEISSPGGMFESRPVQDYDIMHVLSRRRNPILADIFSRLHYMERRGSGFKKICNDYSIQPKYKDELKPKFYSNEHDFVLTLFNLNYGNSEAGAIETKNEDEENSIPKYPKVPQSTPKYPKVPQTSVKLPNNLASFLSVLKQFPGATVQELTKEVQLSDGMIKRYIRTLKELGIIERMGTNRRGYWKINDLHHKE